MARRSAHNNQLNQSAPRSGGLGRRIATGLSHCLRIARQCLSLRSFAPLTAIIDQCFGNARALRDARSRAACTAGPLVN